MPKNLWKKLRLKRWHAELILLGLLLFPVMVFIMWIQQASQIPDDTVLVKKVLVGIVAGVLGQAIWVLGVSVIVINILKEILEHLRRLSPGQKLDKQDEIDLSE